MPIHFLVSKNDAFSRLQWTFLTFQVENVAKSLFTTDFLSSNKRIFASEHRLVRQLVRTSREQQPKPPIQMRREKNDRMMTLLRKIAPGHVTHLLTLRIWNKFFY
jgi:hypothetical protein